MVGSFKNQTENPRLLDECRQSSRKYRGPLEVDGHLLVILDPHAMLGAPGLDSVEGIFGGVDGESSKSPVSNETSLLPWGRL